MLADIRQQATVRTGESLIAHLKEFKLEVNISAGVWYFAPGPIRFHEAYRDPYSIEDRLKIAGQRTSGPETGKGDRGPINHGES